MDLAQLKRAHVLVTGDAMLDRYWFGDAERISPEAPVPVVRVTRTEERLGGAANVARNIATVGASSTLLSVVGNDEAGQSIEKLLRAEGIQPELELDPALKTTVKLRVVARQQQLVRCDFEAMPAEETLKRHLGTFSKLLTTNQALVLSGLRQGRSISYFHNDRRSPSGQTSHSRRPQRGRLQPLSRRHCHYTQPR